MSCKDQLGQSDLNDVKNYLIIAKMRGRYNLISLIVNNTLPNWHQINLCYAEVFGNIFIQLKLKLLTQFPASTE